MQTGLKKKRLSCRLPAPAHLSMAFAYGFGTCERQPLNRHTPPQDRPISFGYTE